LILRWYAAPCIAYAYEETVGIPSEFDCHHATRGRKLGRVIEKVGDGVLDQLRIAGATGFYNWHELERYPAFDRQASHSTNTAHEHFFEKVFLRLHTRSLGIEAGEGEEVVDDGAETS
jgi:hypothetical protein